MPYLLFVVSLFLYIFAPQGYDYNFCLALLVLFITAAFYLVKDQSIRKNYLNFTLLFSISFLFVNFIYPVFIYSQNRYYFVVFERFYFNQAVINKATALALLGYMSFGLGQNLMKKRAVLHSRLKYNFSYLLPYIYYVVLALTVLSVFLLFFPAKEAIISRKSDAFSEVNSSLIVVSQCTITLLVVLNLLLKKLKIHLIIAWFYVLVFLYVGDRGPAIQTVLTYILTYSIFIRRLSRKMIFVIVVLGFLSMTIISSIRTKEGGTIQLENIKVDRFFDLGMDLIVTNRNLYAGYDYVQRNGLNYGMSTVYYLFSPVPLLPTIAANFFYDAEPKDLTTASVLTKAAGANYGLGTNLVIDIYMQYGTFGMIVVLALFGYLIRYLEEFKMRNWYLFIVYVFLFSFSIYIARSSLFDAFRYISWTIILFFIIENFFKPHVSKKITISK